MKCAWQAYLKILPIWMRQEVDRLAGDSLQETRIRLDRPVELVTSTGSIWIMREIKKDDIDFIINTATQYSPWTAADIPQGYITAPGGHRIGLCGDTVGEGGKLGVRYVTSVCIRVARDFPGISRELSKLQGSLLILGRPGSGKTTLLRDLIRQKSDRQEIAVAVVDERGELFPIWQREFCFFPGKRTDVLSHRKKTEAIEILLKTMCPRMIAVDEVTSGEDCEALIRAAWCGVPLMATVHADSLRELCKRSIYRKLLDEGIFTHYVVMDHVQSWSLERVSV